MTTIKKIFSFFKKIKGNNLKKMSIDFFINAEYIYVLTGSLVSLQMKPYDT